MTSNLVLMMLQVINLIQLFLASNWAIKKLLIFKKNRSNLVPKLLIQANQLKMDVVNKIKWCNNLMVDSKTQINNKYKLLLCLVAENHMM